MRLRERMMKKFNKEIKKTALYESELGYIDAKIYHAIADNKKPILNIVNEVDRLYDMLQEEIINTPKEEYKKSAKHALVLIDDYEKKLVELLKERRESFKNIDL